MLLYGIHGCTSIQAKMAALKMRYNHVVSSRAFVPLHSDIPEPGLHFLKMGSSPENGFIFRKWVHPMKIGIHFPIKIYLTWSNIYFMQRLYLLPTQPTYIKEAAFGRVHKGGLRPTLCGFLYMWAG